MNDTVWKAMVEVQQARRRRANDVPKLDVSRPVPRRRKRPTTLRSVRTLLVDDHYAMLAAGEY